MGMAEGWVSLVGAGPGDPGLITVLGARRLAEADVVLYDCLANPALLDQARPEAERILTGKRAGHAVMSQAEINALMVRLAREGKRVVRLKGGDPFVFGRGGEEMEALALAGVPFETIPGVTAGLAGPAYAGIAVTDRELASTVTLVTGHEDETKTESNIDWAALARVGGTIVFYMGVARLRGIADRLMDAGMDAATPTCIIESATLPHQRVVTGRLDTLADQAEAARVGTPGIIVVGRVVARRTPMTAGETGPT